MTDRKVVRVTSEEDGTYTADALWLAGSPPIFRDAVTMDDAVNGLHILISQDRDFKYSWPADLVYNIERVEAKPRPKNLDITKSRSRLCAIGLHDWERWTERANHKSRHYDAITWIYVQQRTCKACGITKLKTQEVIT